MKVHRLFRELHAARKPQFNDVCTTLRKFIGTNYVARLSVRQEMCRDVTQT
jgi:hypothetical protein